MGKFISCMTSCLPCNRSPVRPRTAIYQGSGTRDDITSDMTQVRPGLALDFQANANTERWRLDLTLVDCSRLNEENNEEINVQAKLFADQIMINASKQDSLCRPTSLKKLAARAYFGAQESRADIDRTAHLIAKFDKTVAGLTAPLLNAASNAVREAIDTAKDEDLRQEIAKACLRQGQSCESVAATLQLTSQERNELDLYAVKTLGIPRVRQGEAYKQVLIDLGVLPLERADMLLQLFAAHGPGMVRVARGEDWREVYESFGFDRTLNYFGLFFAYAAIGPGMTRVRNGEDGWAVARSLRLWRGCDYDHMLCNPQQWDEKYSDEVAFNERIMEAGADPERHYVAMIEQLGSTPTQEMRRILPRHRR